MHHPFFHTRVVLFVCFYPFLFCDEGLNNYSEKDRNENKKKTNDRIEIIIYYPYGYPYAIRVHSWLPISQPKSRTATIPAAIISNGIITVNI